MFNKIKSKLKGVFDKSEEVIEEDQQDFSQEGSPQEETKNTTSSQDKDKREEQEVEDLQKDMLEETPQEEQEAIKEHKDLENKDVEKNRERVEQYEEHENENEQEAESLEKEENNEKNQEEQEEKKGGFFSKTVSKFKKKTITKEDFEKIWLDLEMFLLEINVAFDIVEKIEKALKEEIIGNSYDRFQLSKVIREVLIKEVENVLSQRQGDFLSEVEAHKNKGEPLGIMMLGVNGTGKTTSIGKIVKYLQNNNYSVVVAASDTFRAAAVEQLQEHCKKLGVKCITHKHGSDPAAVAYDSIEHAKAKGIDVVLIDTAGRMPNNSNLMMELQKVKRVSQSQMAMFIGDSIAGNDLIEQIELFDKGVEINGVVLTKVDTDERPGSIVTTAYSISKPIYFLGMGQNYEDLVQFDAHHIAEKLFEVDQ